MAEYLPPTENVAIFDTLNFNAGDEALTYNKAVKYFLKYPIAQGTETLQAINVNGIASFLNDVNIGSSTTSNNTPTLTTYKSEVNLGSGGMGTINVECPLNVGGFGSITLTNADITMQDDSYINQTLTHTTPNSLYSINLISGSRIQYPDGKQQNSAFTGGTPGTYTSANITIDSNGKISAISSGAAGAVTSTYYAVGATITIPANVFKIDALVLGKGGLAGGTVVNNGGPVWVGSAGGGGGMCTISSIACQPGNTFSTALSGTIVQFRYGATTICSVNSGTNGALGTGGNPPGGLGASVGSVITSFLPTANYTGTNGGNGQTWSVAEGSLPTAGGTQFVGISSYTKGQINQAFDGFASFGYVNYPADSVGAGGVIITFYKT
jgi:hypothetical protein